MCIAVPVRIMDIGSGPLPMGHVDHAGTAVSCCFAYVPEAKVGDYVVVQNGFAIDVLDEQSARESMDIFTDFAGHSSTSGAREAPSDAGETMISAGASAATCL